MNTFLEIIYLLFFLLYCYLESIFRLVVPVKRKSVKGKIILVTGAGHGIGKEFALEFSRLGGILVLWDINKANNDATADEIREGGGTAYTYVCDVSKLDDIKRVSDQVYRDVGNVDILVNNAGILHGGEILKIKEEDIRRTFDINTMAHFWANNDATADEIREGGGTAYTYVCDVSKLDDIKRVSDQVYRDVGNVDILVNNAGILHGGEILKIKEEDIRRTFDINTMAHFWTLREFLPSMLERNEGHIITVASMAAKSGSAYLVDYSASKFAVFGMTEALSEELHHLHKDGIKTTTVCPMFVDTGLTKYPQGRFGKILSPKEVALEAIDGALKDHVVVMVPRSIQFNVAIGQLFPYRFRRSLKEFMGFGILPQYESSKAPDNKHS
ncbi:hypothetical protein ACJMK2_001922 [Sinanodonta woodiana]|uniref:Short-chain dehydrogenase/reductase 3 n=1 Tax=Sinanodonta woodiana TaxID=1069815 RepID=A0ABD3XVD8_SINWO